MACQLQHQTLALSSMRFLLLSVAAPLAAVPSLASRVRFQISKTEAAAKRTRCCCDITNYSPPQCMTFEHDALLAKRKRYLPFQKSHTCPKVDIFPQDGVGERPLFHVTDGEGCEIVEIEREGRDESTYVPVRRRGSVQALLGVDVVDFDVSTLKGSEVYMPGIPKSIRFLALVSDGEASNGFDVKANAVLLMSQWTVELRKNIENTLTGWPTYDLSLRLLADTWNPEERFATLALDEIYRVERVDVDGRAAIQLDLVNQRQVLLVPFQPDADTNAIAPPVRLTAAASSDQWSLTNSPGVTNGMVCCCQASPSGSVDQEFSNCALAASCSLGQQPAAMECQAVANTAGEHAAVAAAEELGAQLAKAKRVAAGADTARETGEGARLLYQDLVQTATQCHNQAQVERVLETGWTHGHGVEVRTFKAMEGGSGMGGIAGFVRDVWGRHQHIRIGSGASCIDLVRDGATSVMLDAAGCMPFRTKAATVSLVRECLDDAAAAEDANLRAWEALAIAYIGNKRVKDLLKLAGYNPATSWQELLKHDVKRIRQLREAALRVNIQSNYVGVWPLLQRLSVHAQKLLGKPDAYLKQVDRKLDDADKMFWELMTKPSDLHVYPHLYNTKGPRDVVETPAYQALVKDEEVLAEKIMPLMKDEENPSPQSFSHAVGECVRSGECADAPLLFGLMKTFDDDGFWKVVPVGWLATLTDDPSTLKPKPPQKSSLIFPRPSREIFRKCFTAPHMAMEESRELMERLEAQVESKEFLKGHAAEIFSGQEGMPLRNKNALENIQQTLEDASGLFAEDVQDVNVQGALACYPTLFGSLGMEMELRDETGYNEGGKRLSEQEQVLGKCSVAPVCARVAVERLLHFNTKWWEQYARIKTLWSDQDDVCSPNPSIASNCQVFARCFQHEVQNICSELPGCCTSSALQVCTAMESTTIADIRTVLGW